MRIVKLIALALTLLSAAPRTRADSSKEKVYESKADGYRITAPATWKQRAGNPGGSSDVKLILTPDVDLPDGEVLPTFVLTIVTSDQPMQDSEVHSASKGTRNHETKAHPNAKLGDDEDVKLDAHPAVKYTLTSERVKRPVKGFTLVSIRKGKLYLISFWADPATYDAKIAEAQKIVDGFKWEE